VHQKALHGSGVWIEPLFAEAKQWHGKSIPARQLWKSISNTLDRGWTETWKRCLTARGMGTATWSTGG